MTMDWSDKRPLSEIPFAADPTLPEMQREMRAATVRDLLRKAGCATGEDIIMYGCTGLVDCLLIHEAVFVRENMTGSGVGLPCYIPPSRFCLVHNTIGGLQDGQAQRHPEGAPLCSRELTDEEHKRVGAVAMKARVDAADEAARYFGAEVFVGVGAEEKPTLWARVTRWARKLVRKE